MKKREFEIEELSFYSPDVREELVDEDEISLAEAAFMQGYDDAE